jgi:hypothetical protein
MISNRCCGTRLSLNQEPGGDQPRVAGEAGTHRGLSDAHGGGLTGVCGDPAAGPALSLQS